MNDSIIIGAPPVNYGKNTISRFFSYFRISCQVLHATAVLFNPLLEWGFGIYTSFPLEEF
jgi:hypothetical protein